MARREHVELDLYEYAYLSGDITRWKINEDRLSLSLNEASWKCNKQNAYIGTQITEEKPTANHHT